MEGEEAFAAVVVAIKQCEACEREAFLPEPADGLGTGRGEVALVDGKGSGKFVEAARVPLHGWFVERGVVLFEQLFECGDG